MPKYNVNHPAFNFDPEPTYQEFRRLYHQRRALVSQDRKEEAAVIEERIYNLYATCQSKEIQHEIKLEMAKDYKERTTVRKWIARPKKSDIHLDRDEDANEEEI